MESTEELAGGAEAAGGGSAASVDLRALPPGHQRRLILAELRAGRSDLEIGEQFALSQWQVRNLRYRLGLKKGRGGRPRRAGAALAEAPAPAARLAEVVQRMGLRLAGRFSGAEAGRRLSALGSLLAASDGEFEVRVACHEVEAAARR